MRNNSQNIDINFRGFFIALMQRGLLENVAEAKEVERATQEVNLKTETQRYYNTGYPTGADPKCFNQSPDWRPQEIPLEGGRTLVLDPT